MRHLVANLCIKLNLYFFFLQTRPQALHRRQAQTAAGRCLRLANELQRPLFSQGTAPKIICQLLRNGYCRRACFSTMEGRRERDVPWKRKSSLSGTNFKIYS